MTIPFSKKYRQDVEQIVSKLDIYEKYEVRSNNIMALMFFVLFFLTTVFFVLALLGIFNIRNHTDLISIIYGIGIVILLIPAFICCKRRGFGKGLKFMFVFDVALLSLIMDFIIVGYGSLFLIINLFALTVYADRKTLIFYTVIMALLCTIETWLSGTLYFPFVNVITPEMANVVIESGKAVDIEWINKNLYWMAVLKQIVPMKFLAIIFAGILSNAISNRDKRIVNEMSDKVAKSQRLETELSLAHNIQLNMLPKVFPIFPEREEFDIFATMNPAKEVGGDFYDAFLIDDNHLAISISDVSGKGVPAALFMAISKILIKNIAMNDKDCVSTYNKVNATLCDGNSDGLFVTSWFGILDLTTGELHYVNAGHNPPILKHDGEYQYLKGKSSFILAGMDSVAYKENIISISKGDRLFLYTDGITEAIDNDNNQYGEERLISYVRKNDSSNVYSLLYGITEDVNKFCDGAAQFDDMTMLVLDYKKHKRPLVKSYTTLENVLIDDFANYLGDCGIYNPNITSEFKNIVETICSAKSDTIGLKMCLSMVCDCFTAVLEFDKNEINPLTDQKLSTFTKTEYYTTSDKNVVILSFNKEL